MQKKKKEKKKTIPFDSSKPTLYLERNDSKNSLIISCFTANIDFYIITFWMHLMS